MEAEAENGASVQTGVVAHESLGDRWIFAFGRGAVLGALYACILAIGTAVSDVANGSSDQALQDLAFVGIIGSVVGAAIGVAAALLVAWACFAIDIATRRSWSRSLVATLGIVSVASVLTLLLWLMSGVGRPSGHDVVVWAGLVAGPALLGVASLKLWPPPPTN